MNLRAPRRLALLALVAPALALVPTTGPAAAARPDAVASVYAVDEWTNGDRVRLPDEPYTRVQVTYGASYGITPDGEVRSAVVSWRSQALIAPAFDRPIVDVEGDTTFGIALDDEGHIHTWGTPPALSEEDLAATYRDIAAIDGGGIGVTTDGGVRYWGNAAARYPFNPGALDGVEVATIDIESWGAVALTTDGHVLSAGGALQGSYFESTPFPADRADDTFVAVDAGVDFALALTDDGEVVSWGSYQQGEDLVPAFPEGRHAVAVSGGMWWAAAVLDDGSVVTWGNRESTELPTLRADVPVVDIDLDRYRSAVTYAALASTGAPTISGTPEFGTELTATAGEWSEDAADLELHYAWTKHVAGTTTAVGTDSATYTPTAQDALDWATISVTVTASRDGFVSGTATSAETDHVSQRMFATAPSVTVEGQPRVGQALTASITAATPAPDSTEVRWFRAPADDADDAEPIENATDATLTLTPELVGAQVFVNVTSYKEGYQPEFDESEPITVLPGTLAAPTVSVSGSPRVGQVLTATTTAATPAPDSSVLTWFQASEGGSPQQVEGASGATLTLTPALVGARIFAKVTSRKEGYAPVAAQSEPITVLPGTLTAPTVTVSGNPRVGQVLTATTNAAAASYQWLRGSTPIAGATANTYRPTAADLGSALRVRVTSTAAGYDAASADSAPTAAVTLGAAKLKLRLPRKAVVGRSVTISVRGLVPGERFSVKVAGKRLTGKATKSGVGKVRLRVTGKPGSRAVTAIGSQPDRKGTARLRVVPPRRR